MKKIIVFILLFSSLAIVNAQDYFMYVSGEKHYFEISHNKLLVQVTENTETNTIKSIVEKNLSFRVSNISNTDYKEWHLVSFLDTDKTKIMELIQNKNKNGILFSGAVFVDKDGEKIAALTDQIIVRLKQESDYTILQQSIDTFKVDSVWQDEFEKKTYLLKINHSSEKNAIQIANELYETDFFEYAEPNLMLFIKYGTNDTYFPAQWGLKNTGQNGGIAGMDIKATQAWTITTGVSSIKIAILDSGTDLMHPDLIDNLLPGYDATGGNNNGNHSVEPHGTACAGVAAGKGNNSRGIAGVAYNCKILPIHMGSSPMASRVASGLNWTRLNGANIVSMSFSTTETNDVNTAIANANSSGCVLVAATGNGYGSNISYPAIHPNVIAVGAISNNGQRAGFSNYGNEISVVAPGVNIYTSGVLGYTGPPWFYDEINDGANGVYFKNFGGTSAACPHIAGVAVLMLSRNSTLTQKQVKDIIEITAQKVGGYNYANIPERPNGTWNNEMGYGLVNAYNAVLVADCWKNIHNETVNTNRPQVTGCVIDVRNTEITSSGRLELNATGSVKIGSGFKVNNGARFFVR